MLLFSVSSVTSPVPAVHKHGSSALVSGATGANPQHPHAKSRTAAVKKPKQPSAMGTLL
jgi:hypothetical protein